MFGRNLFNCECGGLRHICTKHGHLPEAIEHYHRLPDAPQMTVVWSGRGELLDDRSEHPDDRMAGMPTYDIDDGEVVDVAPRRKYTLTGKHVGRFSRTDPNAPQYIPTERRDPPTEASDNG